MTASEVLVPSAFGVLMVAAAAHRADGVGLWVAAAALAAVLIGCRLRPAAAAAVVLTVATVVLAEPTPMYAVLAGLGACAYLVTRHGAVTLPTTLGAVGFAALASLAVAVPLRLPWLPLAAPLALLGGYLLAVRPYLAPKPDR